MSPRLWLWLWVGLFGAFAACVEDQPSEGTQPTTPPRGSIVIETVLTTCDLRHPGASCRSNAQCGVCDVGGFDVWFWRAPSASSDCLWVFTDAGTTPNTEPQGWDICQEYGGPMDHRTRTP